jgi:hypothetical protein
MIRDCPGAMDYINCGLCKRDPTNNRIVLPNNGWIPRWTMGNNIKERLDDYYRQNPVPAAAAAPVAIPLAPTTGIKDVLPYMSQNLLEVVENLHAAVSADPDNTDDDEAIIQAHQQAQQALEQKKKKQVRFDGVEMPMRKGKALDSILKHPDQVGAAKENQSSAAGPSAPVSRITISTPVITTTARNIPTTAVKNTAVADTSGPQYRYSTPVEDPAIVLKVVNRTLLSPSPSGNYCLSPQRRGSSTRN